MSSYDQWKTASPHDDDPPIQTIAENLCDGRILIGYGKRGHGMNGKDADLNYGGQCLLKSIEVLDPIGADNMELRLDIHCYATICEPSEHDDETDEKLEQRREVAGEVVCTWDASYPGEWTGDDWCFDTDITATVPITVDEYDEGSFGNQKKVLEVIAQRIYDAITSNKEISAFEKSMTALAKAIY
jgi:hypothetical protein